MADLIIENSVVITMDKERRVIGEKFSDGAVAIEDGKILDVGITSELKSKYSADEIIDGRNKVVLPGFIDCHAHPFGFFATGDHLIPRRIGPLHAFIVEHVLKSNNFHTQGLMASIERLKFGTTLGLTMVERVESADYALSFARGVRESGAKGIICPIMGENIGEYGSVFPRIADGLRQISKNGVLGAMVGTSWLGGAFVQAKNFSTDLHAYKIKKPTKLDLKNSKEAARTLRDLMKKFGTGMHSHATKGMIEFAAKTGLKKWLGPDVVLAHCRGITNKEIGLLAKTRTNVAHCPYVYAMGGAEPMRLVEFLQKRVNVGLGSDHGIRISFDLFKEMKAAMILQRIRFKHRWVIPPGKALEMATIDGARALGKEHEVGSIEPGKKADLILIDVFKPHLTPMFNLPTRIVLEADGHDVDTVMVDGKVVVRNRQLQTLDESKVLNIAQQEAQQIIGEANCEVFLERAPDYWSSPYY